MKFKKYKIFLLLVCLAMGTQQTSNLTEKIILENSIRDKVISSVSKLIRKNDFLVIVNVDLSTVEGVLRQPSNSKSNNNTYSPFPGLPTIPKKNNLSNPNWLYIFAYK